MQAHYETMQQIRRANDAAGQYWFEPGALKFFSSRIQTAPPIAGQFFVTSEQFRHDYPRLYTVRTALENGAIETVGMFQQFTSSAQARAALRRAIDSGPERHDPHGPYWTIIHYRLLIDALTRQELRGPSDEREYQIETIARAIADVQRQYPPRNP